MLMPVKPETLKTLEEIRLLEIIRDEIIEEARNDPTTDLNEIFHECGTPSCLMGRCIQHDILDEFGASDWLNSGVEPEYWKIFGSLHKNSWMYAGTLDDRAAACTRIIERKMREIAGH